jgi:hypothetical protein
MGHVGAPARAAIGVPELLGGTQLAVGDHQACALGPGGLGCTGLLPRVRGVALAMASAGGCIVGAENVCWGDVVPGPAQGQSAPRPMFPGATQIAVGTHFACAVLESQQVACLGWNDAGQLGAETSPGCSDADESIPCAGTPVPVRGIEQATMVAAGARHACARTLEGEVLCWGDNSSLQLGAPRKGLMPVKVPLKNVQSVAVGERHSCALTVAGEVFCWGGNRSGQLGKGDTVASERPALAGTFPKASTLAASGETTCLRTPKAEVYCWGKAQSVAGSTDADTRHERPSRVPGL